MNQLDNNHNARREAVLMFEILNFARLHEKRIYEKQLEMHFGGEKTKPSIKKLISAEYFRKVKKGEPFFYVITSKGLNLFENKWKEEFIPEDVKNRILEKLSDVIAKLKVKPWETMFHIIHVIGNRQPITTEEILDYFQVQFQDIKGISRPNVYRNLQRLRMKGYIEYEKVLYRDQSPYQLSEKGKEIFNMTRTDATQRLRSAEEWDAALTNIFRKVDAERKQNDEALYYTLIKVLPDNLDDSQRVWALYTQGTIFELKGNLNKAEEMYIRMDGICEELEDTRGRAYALKGSGNVAFKKEKYTVAEQYYKRCKKIAQTLEDKGLLSDVLNNLGSCKYMNDDVDGALHTFEEALTLVGDDTSKVASTLYNEGLCYARKEDFAKAQELWEKSLDLYKTLQNTIEIAKVEHNLREVDRKQKREYAWENYRKAKKFGTSEDIKEAYRELVKILMGEFNG